MKSMNEKSEVGVIGLGVMGENLLLNIADHGYRAIGLDKDETKVRALENAKKTLDIWATNEVAVFLSDLRLPRAIILLVPAGQLVDVVLEEIVPLLSQGDLVIDAGNSHFTDTDRREKKLTAKGIYFFGMGISGGESGARNGPSLMPGGDKLAYERVQPILEAIAAKVNGEPCVAYLGPRSAGHYVKMVHNGIEYGLMQLISETYHLMKVAFALSDEQCSAVYQEWNDSELNSYLLQITSQIFLKKDDKTGGSLIDLIKGIAREQGTGKWTCQDAMELQVPVPNMDVAVGMRDLSRFSVERKMANQFLPGPEKYLSEDRDVSLKQLKNAYYASLIITFAQGFSLLRAASSKYQYRLSLQAIARIWRGGCIIRASVLDTIISSERKSPDLGNLLLGSLGGEVQSRQTDLRAIVRMGAEEGLPLPGMMAALAYYDGFRSAWLPANLIQAQRDYFGAHTYERIDQAGTFHTQWGDR